MSELMSANSQEAELGTGRYPDASSQFIATLTTSPVLGLNASGFLPRYGDEMQKADTEIETGALVDALYRVILSREADPEGRADKLARLDGGQATVEQIISEVLGSHEFVDTMPETLARLGNAKFLRLTNDASQYGEFLELLKLWIGDTQSAGVVVDVGARGRARSNSYDLLSYFGWRGLLIEANSNLLPAISNDFAGLDHVLINCAVSDFEGEATLTIGANDDVSSLNVEMAEAWGQTRGSLTVPARRLGPLMVEHGIPYDFDLLSIDIEGEDIKVLNDLIGFSAYRPRWIIIEASHDFTVRTLDDRPFSDAVKASYAIRGQTRANLILGRRSDQGDGADIRPRG